MRKLLLVLTAFLLLTGTLWAQKTITGKVTDDKGNPIPNASVQVRGTNTGTTTKADGTYTLTVPANATRLVISSVGMVPQELSIGSGSTVDAQLETTVQDLAEVVVTVPYGTVKKTAFTGSETTVTSKVLERQQVTSVTKALDGLAPGIMTTNGGGAPGSGASIIIRGFASINNSQSPLYVLNGVPYDGSIAALNMDDIETVTVLKDAAATALYGSRSAGGVIMITTKSGKRGKPTVDATIRQGYMSRGIPEYDRVGPQEYYELMWEATRNSFQYGNGMSPAAAAAKASAELTDANHLVYNAYNVPGNQLVDPATGKLNPNASLLWNESWEDALFRTAARTNATVSVAGAGDKSSYRLSAGYLNEEGTMINTDYKRYNFRLDLRTQPSKWINAGLTMDGAFARDNSVIGSGSFTSNPFYYSRNMGPIYPIYQHDPVTGAFVMDPLTGQPALDWGNPSQMGTRPYAPNSNLLGSLMLDERSSKVYNGNANGYIEVILPAGFSFKTTLGVNMWENQGTTYQNNQYGDAQNISGRSTKSFDRRISYTLNEVLTYTKEFGKNNLRVLVGHENYSWQRNFLSATKIGFQIPGQTELDNGGTTEGSPSSFEDHHTIESYFSSLTYDYDGKYLLSGGVRRDGSSRFGPDYRWGNFYSAGIGWRISQEAFMQNINWLNELKLKASFGEVGNENIGALYADKNYLYADGFGNFVPPTPGRLADPTLQWEKNQKFNAGFDFAMFKNRLQGTIEYFTNASKDLIFDVPQPYSPAGVQFVYRNIGKSTNKGIEIQLGYNAIRKRNFDWRIDVNFTSFKNEVTQLPANQSENGIVSGTKKIAVGHSIFDFWLREFAGVDASTGEALYYRDVLGADGKPTGQRTLTNNITQASFYWFDTAIPDFFGGITNSFRYKDFDFSFLVTYSYGGKFYDGNYAGLMHYGAYGTAWHTDIRQRWQKPGDVTNVPKIQNAVANQDGQSSRYLMDGSYLNIKNVTLSYSVPKTVTSKIGIPGATFYANVDNVVLFTAKKGMDPQRSFNGTSDASFPPFRTFTVGLNLSL